MQALVLRRHADLDRAIVARAWFDPWVFELDDDASPSESVSPWVAGFALATEQFPALLRNHDAAALTEPLALLFRHLDAEDLEDADELLAEIGRSSRRSILRKRWRIWCAPPCCWPTSRVRCRSAAHRGA